VRQFERQFLRAYGQSLRQFRQQWRCSQLLASRRAKTDARTDARPAGNARPAWPAASPGKPAAAPGPGCAACGGRPGCTSRFPAHGDRQPGCRPGADAVPNWPPRQAGPGYPAAQILPSHPVLIRQTAVAVGLCARSRPEFACRAWPTLHARCGWRHTAPAPAGPDTPRQAVTDRLAPGGFHRG
jgi:hypothetical protein